MTSPAPKLLTNATIFTATPCGRAEAMVVRDGRIWYVGDADTARRVAGADATTEDLGGALVLPGFVDGHAHIVSTGDAQTQVDLWGAQTLAEIQQRISTWAAQHPDAPRVRATGSLPAAIPGARGKAEQLDAVVADRPVYVTSFDGHSVWVNTAALAELGIDDTTANPVGGTIERDAAGKATGYIDETALEEIVQPVLYDAITPELQDEHLAAALAAYARDGVTAAVDMGLDQQDIDAMRRAEAAGTLTTRIVGHWLVPRRADDEANLAEVHKAIELARECTSPWLRVTGIKVVIDGTVDGCTAALGKPYADGNLVGPIWDRDALFPVVTAADAAGLQVAMHAIGDEAIRIAIDAVEHAVRVNGPRLRRHRIEHLEVSDPADIARLAALGITASMQPVHSDPAIQDNWRAQLGDDRIERGFAWPDMTAAGATLALGTDSPTSPHMPLHNMYVAATRKSALQAGLEPNLPHFALPLDRAITHGTRDAAWSCLAEDEFGSLAAGLAADYVVVDRDVLATEPEQLLEAKVLQTVVGGTTVWSAS